MSTSSEPSQQQDIMAGCFLAPNPCLFMHVHTLLTNKDAYLATVKSMCQTGVFATLSQAVKARAFIALEVTNQHSALRQLLPHCQVVEIVKALVFLDRQRRMRQLTRQIEAIENAHPHLKTADATNAEPARKRRTRNIDRLRRQLAALLQQKDDASHTDQSCAAAHANTAVQELIDSASLSGALARKIREWARQNLTKDSLEFVVLTMPMGNWKKLADLVHFAPTDFSLPYFLSAVHGEPLPEGSFVQGLRCLMDSNGEDLVARYQVLAKKHPPVYKAFNFLRTQPHLLQEREIVEDLARHVPLSTAIWYLEELAQSSREIPDIVGHRLRTENWMADEASKVTASFGKLLERLLTFQSRNWSMAKDLMVAAETRLSALKEMYSNQQSDLTTIVLGDASSSMQSAIEASTILATMISVCWGAELCFFNHGFVASPHPRPSTVQETLRVCQTIRASGATSLAAALWPYYEQKRKVDRIVLVTDEEENTNCNGFMFAPLLKAYKESVNANVELIVICVDSGDRRFRDSLVSNGIDCKRIEIDGRRPDLTKFDAMLGQIAMASSSSNHAENTEQIESVEEEFVVV